MTRWCGVRTRWCRVLPPLVRSAIALVRSAIALVRSVNALVRSESAVMFRVRRRTGFDVLVVLPHIRPRSVEIGEAVGECRLAGRQGALIPSLALGIRRHRRDGSAHISRRFRNGKARTRSAHVAANASAPRPDGIADAEGHENENARPTRGRAGVRVVWGPTEVGPYGSRTLQEPYCFALPAGQSTPWLFSPSAPAGTLPMPL